VESIAKAHADINISVTITQFSVIVILVIVFYSEAFTSLAWSLQRSDPGITSEGFKYTNSGLPNDLQMNIIGMG